MPCFSIGPIDIRYYAGQNWSSIELAFVTARKAGLAQRETAIRTSFKSEHLLETCGTENPSDTVTVNGTTYAGRVAEGVDGVGHTISAAQVAARAQVIAAYRRAQQDALNASDLSNGDMDAPGASA